MTKINLLYKPTNPKNTSKLKTVRGIMDLSGLGLREAKDIADDLYNSPNLPKIITCKDSINTFDIKKILLDFPDEIQVSSKEEERNIKILSLGLGEIDEYRETLEYYLGFETSNSLIIKELVSVLTKEQMIYLSKIITKEFYGE